MRLAADAPGQVISVPDPDTGGIILVGTQRQPGQALVVARRTPELALLPGWQGVAMLPISDSLSLRTTPQGFLIEAGAGRALAMGALDADAEAQADAEHLTRRFDFPDLPPEALRRRLLAAIDDAAATPAQSRGPKRIAVARAMLSLGMGAEAEAVLALTATDDPRLTDDPDRRALSAIAALIAGRPGEANALDDPSLTGTDEIALWRAVRSAMAHEGAAKAAPVFAADIALPLAYPGRAARSPVAIDGRNHGAGGRMEGGKAAAGSPSRTYRDDHSLDLARGFVAEAEAREAARTPKRPSISTTRWRPATISSQAPVRPCGRSNSAWREPACRRPKARMRSNACSMPGAATGANRPCANASPSYAAPPANGVPPWPCCAKPSRYSPSAAQPSTPCSSPPSPTPWPRMRQSHCRRSILSRWPRIMPT